MQALVRAELTRSKEVATDAIARVVHQSETVSELRVQLKGCMDPNKNVIVKSQVERRELEQNKSDQYHARNQITTTTGQQIQFACNNPACQQIQAHNKSLMRCSRCRSAQYCCKKCQVSAGIFVKSDPTGSECHIAVMSLVQNVAFSSHAQPLLLLFRVFPASSRWPTGPITRSIASRFPESRNLK